MKLARPKRRLTSMMDTNDLKSLLDPNYAVFGADTSLWTLEVDFEAYRRAGPSFVIIKALHGTTIDPYFERNYARARAAGVPVSSYQWLLPEGRTPIGDQVRAYTELLRDHPHDLVPWLDYEGEAGGRDLIRHVDLFRETSGANLGVYSTYGRLNDATPALPDHFSSLRLWIAKYSTNFPGVPRPFKNWDLWQFTETFPGAGLGFTEQGEHRADMNYFNGSPDTFRAFCLGRGAGTPREELDRRIAWEVPAAPLAMGDSGIRVLKLQDLLVRQGFMANEQVAGGPGIFGPRTRTALASMQAALGLAASSVFDEATRRAVLARYYVLDTTAPIEVPPSGPVPGGAPAEERSMFDGNAVYRRYVVRLPRGEVTYHVLKVDLLNAEVFVTPAPRGLKMVPALLEDHKMDIAVNGDGWTMRRTIGGYRVQTTGENASRGKIYGQAENQMAFYLDAKNRVSWKRPATRQIWNAISFPNLLVENGQIFPRIARADIDPRTAIGFTRDGRYAILVAVDGAETYNSKGRSGMNFTEVAAILIREGAWMASNQDGGGSTTMAVRDDKDGAVRILNQPCGEAPYRCRGKTYSMRPVANAFCIRFMASTPGTSNTPTRAV